jgi:hypothetical protein
MKKSRVLLMALCFSFLVFEKSYAQTFHLKTTEFLEISTWGNDGPDIIAGHFDIHYMVNIIHGNVFNWAKTKRICGDAVSQSTGEVFRVNYHLKEDPWLPGTKKVRSFHCNLVGDKGTHLIMAFTLGIDQDYNFSIIKLKEKLL